MRKKETMNCNKKETVNGKKDTVFSERLRDLFVSMPYDRVDLSRRVGVPISTIVTIHSLDGIISRREDTSKQRIISLQTEKIFERKD